VKRLTITALLVVALAAGAANAVSLSGWRTVVQARDSDEYQTWVDIYGHRVRAPQKLRVPEVAGSCLGSEGAGEGLRLGQLRDGRGLREPELRLPGAQPWQPIPDYPGAADTHRRGYL